MPCGIALIRKENSLLSGEKSLFYGLGNFAVTG